jgi:hypothetical protein
MTGNLDFWNDRELKGRLGKLRFSDVLNFWMFSFPLFYLTITSDVFDLWRNVITFV